MRASLFFLSGNYTKFHPFQVKELYERYTESMQERPHGIYQHYKGKKYLVLRTAKHSETLEELVVYVALYENEKSPLWVRPLQMFLEEVEVNGKKVPRFRKVSES